MPLTIATAAASDVGLRRSHNEDSHAVIPGPEGEQFGGGVLVIVADGMGGTNAGEVASGMAVSVVGRAFFEVTTDDPAKGLHYAIEAANQEIFVEASMRPECAGMGTTCTAVWLKGDRAWVAHVGDSRAYLLRGSDLRSLTMDHSLVAQLVQRKQITPEQARHDPRRNVVTRSVGVAPSVEVDAAAYPDALQSGDTIVLCSDGLHGVVAEEDIARLAAGESLQSSCDELIALANEHGGPDNITVALARVTSIGGSGGVGEALVDLWRRMFGGKAG